jgi:acyl-coenzyme A synthetase/AMP-(fatty) acid ligase
MTEPGLGAGNFLDYALKYNPNRDVHFVYTHGLDHRGQVTLRGHSLVDLAALRDRYAKWYHMMGVRPGDPVGIVVAEGFEPLLHFLALTALGAIPAPINDAMRADVMVRYLNYVGVVGVVADDTTRLAAAYRADPQSRPRFVAPAHELAAFDDSSAPLPDVYPYPKKDDDIVAIIHSSGTTGTPKGTTLSHKSFWDGKQDRMIRFPAEPYDKLMSLMPHTHAGGLSYFLTITLLGLPTVIMGDWRRKTVEPVMEAFQPTMLSSFPRTFVELATGDLPTKGAAKVHSWFNTADAAHWGHIRRLITLGERPAGLIKPWLLPKEAADEEPLAGSRYVDGLGSSEMGMALFGGLFTPESPRADRSVGKPQPAVEHATVLDPDGNELPVGQVGMLAVKAPSITPGYWKNPRLTESFWLNGYFLTGDVARMDGEGNFYHLDRTIDVIDTLSGPAYSLEIEEILIADCWDYVRDCNVVGIPGPNGGQVPIAVVQLQADAEASGVTEEMVLDKANKELSEKGLHQLSAVKIARTAEDYPLGPTGKVLKRELRTRFATLLTS